MDTEKTMIPGNLIIPRSTARDDDRDVRSYEIAIRENPLLEREEEVKLTRRVQAGDVAALKKLIQSNLRLVVSIARDFEHLGLPTGDLIREGNAGLAMAAIRFQAGIDDPFAHFAREWIHQMITSRVSGWAEDA